MRAYASPVRREVVRNPQNTKIGGSRHLKGGLARPELVLSARPGEEGRWGTTKMIDIETKNRYVFPPFVV